LPDNLINKLSNNGGGQGRAANNDRPAQPVDDDEVPIDSSQSFNGGIGGNGGGGVGGGPPNDRDPNWPENRNGPGNIGIVSSLSIENANEDEEEKRDGEASDTTIESDIPSEDHSVFGNQKDISN